MYIHTYKQRCKCAYYKYTHIPTYVYLDIRSVFVNLTHMRTCIHIYIYMHCRLLNTYVYTCIYIYTHGHTLMCCHMFHILYKIFIYTHAIYIEQIHLYNILYLYRYVYTCACIYIHTHVYVYVCIYIYICICTYVCICICLYKYTYIYAKQSRSDYFPGPLTGLLLRNLREVTMIQKPYYPYIYIHNLWP